MGQILLVQGQDPKAVASVFERALLRFASLHGVAPSHRLVEGGTGVARFQPLHFPAGGFVRDEAAGTWGAAAGAWLYAGARGDGPLAELTRPLLEDGASLDRLSRWLDGYFLLAAGNPAAGEAVVMTDRGGGLHAYRTTVDGVTLVSTSALVLGALRGAGLDPVAVRELLGANSVFEERSLFAGVEKLPGGTVFRFRAGALASRVSWFDIASLYWDRAPIRGDVPDLAAALVEAVGSVFAAWPQPILDLTGGYDSRNILGAALAAAPATGRPLATVVAGADGDPDVVAAAGIARALGLDHRQIALGRELSYPTFADLGRALASGDGEANVLDQAPVVALQARTAADHDVSVNGSYGELCRGYWWSSLFPRLCGRRGFDARKLATGRFTANGWTDAMSRGRFADTVADHFTGVVERAVHGLDGLPNTAKADQAYFAIRMQRWAGRLASATLRSRPCIAPFMFLGPLAAALSAPPVRRLGGRMAPALAEHLHPGLAALPMAGGYPALPLRPGTLHRFLPLAAELAKKAGGRLARKLGRPAPAAPTQVWEVWALPEVAELMRPEAMLTRDLYDEPALRGFLAGWRDRRPLPLRDFGKLLTLELAARAVR